jgi:hypothetical protein
MKIIGSCYKDFTKTNNGEFRKQPEKLNIWIDTTKCKGGNGNLNTRFKSTWMNVVGQEKRKIRLGRYVGTLNSWTAALALLEDGIIL